MKLKTFIIAFLFFICLILLGGLCYIGLFQETKELNENTRKEIGGSFIKLSQGTVSYDLEGPDTGKTVILLHGAGSGRYAWDKNAAYLAQQGFRVLSYDMYGRGFSDRPDIVYDSTLFNHQLCEIIDSLKLKPPYNIVAVSMGATVGLHYVAQNKSLVSHLILVDPASISNGNIAWHLRIPVFSGILMGAYWYPRAVEKQMREFFDPTKVPEYRTKSNKNLEYKGLKRAMLSTWQNVLPLDMKSAMEEIGKSDVKVLLVWGNNDPLISPKASSHYLTAMPKARLEILDSAGHLSNYERPEKFNPLVTKFLRND